MAEVKLTTQLACDTDLPFAVEGRAETAKRNQTTAHECVDQALGGLLAFLQEGRHLLSAAGDLRTIERKPSVQGVMCTEGQMRGDAIQPVEDPRLERRQGALDVRPECQLLEILNYAPILFVCCPSIQFLYRNRLAKKL